MICETMAGDNRFEIIARAKHAILEGTNIETSEDEMKVLDNILFRCWQMGWLDKYDDRPTGEWIKSNILPNGWHCSNCDAPVMTDDITEMLFCPHCGSEMGGESNG